MKLPSKIKKFFFYKFPNLSQWKNFFCILSKKEKILFFTFFFLAIVSSAGLNLNYYFQNTIILPKTGGEYKEGLIGQPRFINPIYLSNNDIDRDLVELMFSGLLKYDEQGKIIKDLAKDLQIKDDGKLYEFRLKDKIFWHDGNPLSVEDIIFTIQLIQDPQYKSPQNVEWLGIRVETQGSDKIVFQLQKKYSSFLETIANLKILPKHIFQDVPPENFSWILSSKEYLIGSGPFQIEEINKDNSGYIFKINLKRNDNYFLKPFLEKITFYFYQNFEDLLHGAELGEIDGFSVSDSKYLKDVKDKNFQFYRLSLPRYFALFFNLKDSKLLQQKKIREALNYAIDKNEILDKVFLSEGEIVNSPILSEYFNFATSNQVLTFNLNKAKQILDEQGFKLNQLGKRVKIEEKESSPIFKSNLTQGSKGEEVKELQRLLAKDKKIYPEAEISGYFGVKTKQAVIRFQEKYANEILVPANLKKGTGEVRQTTRKKLNQICCKPIKETIPLKFTLTTSDKFPLVEIADILKKQFEKIGIEIELKKVPFSDFQINVLSKRNFEMLLFGKALGQIPDLFPFWHSSQKNYPGLNFTNYESNSADKLLIEARENLDEKQRRESLEQLQEVLLKDLPAVFLVRSHYLYFLSSKIKGYKTEKITQPSKRFSNIEKWYKQTHRVWR